MSCGEHKPTQSLQNEFYTEEYRRVGAALEAKVLESTELVRNVVLSCAAILAWLTATDYNPSTGLRAFAWAVPVGICGFGWLRSWGIGAQMNAITDYLKKLESQFAQIPGLPGYHNYNAVVIIAKSHRTRLFALTDINWFFGLLAIACLACWYSAKDSNLCTILTRALNAWPFNT